MRDHLATRPCPASGTRTLAVSLRGFLSHHDAERECRHGHLQDDPSPGCRCFRGRALRLVQMVEDALTLAEQLLAVALRVADRLESGADADEAVRELRRAARKLEQVLGRAA